MRGGVRPPAMMIAGLAAGCLLAGCSDPAGAARRERAATRTASATPRATPSRTTRAPRPAARSWWQAPGTTKTAHGLRVRTGPLRDGRIMVRVTDVAGRADVQATVTATARRLKAGRFTLTAVRVRPHTRHHAGPGIGFHYRRH